MKKCLAVLISVFIFSAIGCSDEYMSERALYMATKLARKIIITPEAVPPQEFEGALNAYKKIYEKYPDTWTARRARLAMGSLYLSKKEYEEGREVFTTAIDLYPDDKNISLEARFAIAKSYETEGLWDKALSKYNEIIRDYPDTGVGFGLPMYIAEKDKDYMGAVAHYDRVARENPNSEMGYRAEDLVVTCYVKMEDWPRALKGMKRIIMDYPMARNLGLEMRMIGEISIKRLNAPEMAIQIFEEFLEKNPEHPAKEAIKKGLEELRNVRIGE